MLVLYVLERFLARLSLSAYADRFVLKGGLLLAAWDARRATVDWDFLARNLAIDSSSVRAQVVEIASIRPPDDDGVEYRVDTATASTIRDADLYGGVRVVMDAVVSRSRVKLRLDISTGDPVTPPPAQIAYPTLRAEHPDIPVLGHPLPVVLAEKICTAVDLGATNSRIRDYADIWTLTGMRDLDGHDLTAALDATARHRDLVLSPLSAVLGRYGTERAAGYAAYLRRLGPDAEPLPATFVGVVDAVTAFADPVLGGSIQPRARWRSSSRTWPLTPDAPRQIADGRSPLPHRHDMPVEQLTRPPGHGHARERQALDSELFTGGRWTRTRSPSASARRSSKAESSTSSAPGTADLRSAASHQGPGQSRRAGLRVSGSAARARTAGTAAAAGQSWSRTAAASSAVTARVVHNPVGRPSRPRAARQSAATRSRSSTPRRRQSASTSSPVGGGIGIMRGGRGGGGFSWVGTPGSGRTRAAPLAASVRAPVEPAARAVGGTLIRW
ncbi:MAG: nucleotidyl transferase AbiEii/AbiGii toxin family protein [Streptomycetales bacterium]